MSELLEDYQQTVAALADIQAKLEKMKAAPKLQRFLEFEKKLRSLMGEYGCSLVDINRLLDPNYKAPEKPAAAPAQPLLTQSRKVPSKAKSARNARGGKPLKEGERKRAYKPRRGRTFTNPNTGAKIYYLGGINKELEDWRKKWGKDVVDSWGVLDPETPVDPVDPKGSQTGDQTGGEPGAQSETELDSEAQTA